MPLLVAILLGLAAMALVAYPLIDTPISRRGRTTSDAGSIEAESVAKQALRDIDFDHRLGNLDASDYLALRDRYEERALAAMKARYDQERAGDALIDEQLAVMRSQDLSHADGRSAKTAKTAKAQSRTDTPARSDTPSPSVYPTSHARNTSSRKAGLSRRRGV